MEAALAACARPAMMGDTLPTDRHWARLLEQVRATGKKTSVISSEFFADAPDDETVTRIVRQLGGDRVHIRTRSRTPASGGGTGTTGWASAGPGPSDPGRSPCSWWTTGTETG